MMDLLIDKLQKLALHDQSLNEIYIDFENAEIKTTFGIFDDDAGTHNLLGYVFRNVRNLSISHISLDDFYHLEIYSHKVEAVLGGLYLFELQLYQGPNNPSGLIRFKFLECQSQ